MADIKRYVLGPDDEGRSTILESEPVNIQTKDGFFWRSTLWATQELPVDNTIEGDRSLAEGVGAKREPHPGGMLVRALELWPDMAPDQQRAEFATLNTEVEQKHLPTQADSQRHPTMHRTDTLDSITIARGEIYLVTDEEEVLMRPGDTVIIRGVNHGWSNRSDSPCLLVGTMIDATPAQTGHVSGEQENNKAIVAHFNKAFIEGGDMDVYERTMDPAFVNHTPNPGQSAGPDGAAYFFNEILRPAFPDLVVTIHDQLAEDDKVVTRKSYRATHRGDFLGVPATGRTVDFAVTDVIRLRNGRYVEHWAIADMAGLRAQLAAG